MNSKTAFIDQLDPKTRWLVDEGISHLAVDSKRIHSPRQFEAWQRDLIQTQLRLLHRGRRRFAQSHRWLWTERSLAQASDWWTASAKASLFPAAQRVVDACCGAGADAIALSHIAEVTAVDLDPVMCAFAEANAVSCGQELNATCEAFSSRTAKSFSDRNTYLHIDPDRRPGERRTNDAEEFSPSLGEVLECSEFFSGSMIKLAPTTRMSVAIERQIEQTSRVWVGNLGECRQQLLLTGSLATSARGVRMAILAEPDAEPVVFQGQTAGYTASVFETEEFVYDLHPVLHASGMHTAWATQHGLRPLGDEHGYFTGGQIMDTPWAQRFEVIEQLAWDDRKVRKWLRSAEAGVVEIKNRLVPLNASEFQRRYRGKGGNPITLLVTRLGDRVRAIAAKRP